MCLPTSTTSTVTAKMRWLKSFVKLNTALVKFGPDDLLRAREVSSPPLQHIRTKCKYVGYDHIRRSDSSPILSMSQTLRSWYCSEPDVPHTRGSVAEFANRITLDDATDLTGFLKLAYEAWGREPGYARLWASLNLTLTMWIYRRSVLAPSVKLQRRTHLTKEQYGKCLMSLSADSTYLDYLLGRKLNDDHRGPTYARIKQVFVRRLQDEGVAHAIFPNTTWSSR